MRISTIGYQTKQGFKNIGRNKMFSIASIATMAACIFLFGIFFSIVTNFRYMVQKAEEGVAITVFFDEEATDAQIKKIGDELKSQNVVSYAEKLDGVSKVNKSDVVAKTLTSVNRLIYYVSIVLIGILLAVSIFLISNTVTMGITVRREEIAIMKYIGAKDGFVRAPFIIEGLVIGLIGAVIPLVILYFVYDKAVAYVMTKFSLLNNIIEFLPVTTVYRTLLPVGLILGVGIGFIGSAFTIRKHLRV